VSPNAAKKNAPTARRQVVFRMRLQGLSGFGVNKNTAVQYLGTSNTIVQFRGGAASENLSLRS
jgi:hypothetical protein